MSGEYAIGGLFIAAAPVEACIALALALALHRLLVMCRAYRWVWHPVLFDTAMFLVIWALLVCWVPPLFHGLNP